MSRVMTASPPGWPCSFRKSVTSAVAQNWVPSFRTCWHSSVTWPCSTRKEIRKSPYIRRPAAALKLARFRPIFANAGASSVRRFASTKAASDGLVRQAAFKALAKINPPAKSAANNRRSSRSSARQGTLRTQRLERLLSYFRCARSKSPSPGSKGSIAHGNQA